MGSTVPAQGRFRRQIGTESCHRVGSRAYRHGILSVYIRRHIGMAAIDTGSSFFMRETAIPAKLGLYPNSRLYLLDDNIPEYAYREWYLKGI